MGPARFKLPESKRKAVYLHLLLRVTEYVTGRGMKMDREAMDSNCRRVARWLTNARAKPSLILSGRPGTGKTTLLKALSDTLEQFHVARKMYVATDLQTAMIETPETFRDTVLHGSWADYLLLDDIGEEPVTVKDYGRDLPLFTKIVAERYERMLPIILTTNLSFSDISTTYGVRTFDRLHEVADELTFNGVSYR